MSKPGPKPKKPKLSKKEKKITQQYLSSLKRSLERVDGITFDFYSIKLSNPRLLKFLLGKAYIEKTYLPDMIEELIIKGLAHDKSYKDYVDNDLAIKIEVQPTLRFYSQSWAALQKERNKGKSGATAS